MDDLRFLTIDRLRELIREIVLEVLEPIPSRPQHSGRLARQGWGEQFQAASSGDPGLLDPDDLTLTIWDETEWEC